MVARSNREIAKNEGSHVDERDSAGAKVTKGGGARRRPHPAPYPFWARCEEQPNERLSTDLVVEDDDIAGLRRQ